MQLKQDAPPVCWRSIGIWWLLAYVGGYVGGSGVSYLYLLGTHWSIIRNFFGQSWTPTFSFLLLLLPFLGPAFASIFQWLLLRNYLTNPFRWVKFTLIGGLCGAAISYPLHAFNPNPAFQVICGLIDCAIELDKYGVGYSPVRLTYAMVLAIAAYLPIPVSQGLTLRPLGLPLVWWCLAWTGSHFLLSIPLTLLAILLVGHYEPFLEQMGSMGVELMSLLWNLQSSVFKGLIVGFVTALFIVPLLRKARDEVEPVGD